jgi:transposase
MPGLMRGAGNGATSRDRRACNACAWTAPDDHRHRASPLLYTEDVPLVWRLHRRCFVVLEGRSGVALGFNRARQGREPPLWNGRVLEL